MKAGVLLWRRAPTLDIGSSLNWVSFEVLKIVPHPYKNDLKRYPQFRELPVSGLFRRFRVNPKRAKPADPKPLNLASGFGVLRFLSERLETLLPRGPRLAASIQLAGLRI